MAKKKPLETTSTTQLSKPKEIFKNELMERISIGENLSTHSINSENEVITLYKDYSDWNDYNIELIKRAFNKPDSEYFNEYFNLNRTVGFYDSMRSDINTNSLAYKIDLNKRRINNAITWLNRLVTKINLIDESNTVNSFSAKDKTFFNRGFIIHGHNEAKKFEVARYIESDLRLKVTILHEQPSKGLTIIEKFEAHSSVDFAVALWTADDDGKAKTQENLNDRARQNVIFETGFFIGKLGRRNVIVLYEQGVDIPSDYSGIIFILLSGNWKDDLRKEIDAIYQIVS